MGIFDHNKHKPYKRTTKFQISDDTNTELKRIIEDVHGFCTECCYRKKDKETQQDYCNGYSPRSDPYYSASKPTCELLNTFNKYKFSFSSEHQK